MTEDTTKIEPQTVLPSGAMASKRFVTADAAYLVYKDFKTADELDAKRRATLQGMIDGNPPYNAKKLEELGLGYIQNVNFLEMRANLDARAGAAHELFTEVPTLIEAKLEPTFVASLKGEPDPGWGNIVAEEFTRMLQDWSGFLPTMDLVVRESDAYGIGGVIWENEWDWRPKAFKRGSLLFEPKSTKLDINENEVYMVRNSYAASSLYRFVANEKDAEAAGWKVKTVRDLLVSIYVKKDAQTNAADEFQRSDWESLEQLFRNNDSLAQKTNFQRVKIVHILTKDADDGKITHQILADDETWGKVSFLFEAPKRYAKMSEAIWLLPFNYGDGYAKSVRGVASMMAPHDDLSNRFLGRVFDAGFIISSLLLQPKTGADLSKMQLVRLGPMTMIPPDLTLQQASFQPQIASLVQLRDLSARLMKNNTGTYRQHVETFAEAQAQKTARQVAEESNKEARFEKADVAHRYNAMEALYREIWRRVVRPEYLESESDYPGKAEAVAFVARCEARQVPRMLLLTPGAFRVVVSRAIGLGSLGMRLDITNQVLGSRFLMDEAGQAAAFRDWLAARVGQHNVDRYKPLKTRDLIASNETSFATLENNDFAEGANVPVGSDQTHTLHLRIHFELLQQVVQAVQETQGQGLDVPRVLGLLKALLPHVGQHLQYLAADPLRKEVVRQGVESLKMGTELVGQLEQLAAKQMKEQAKLQQEQQAKLARADEMIADRELEAKIFEINKKYELETMKQQSLNAMRAAKTETNRERAQQDMQLKAARQTAELEMDAIAQQAKREIAGAK